MTVWVTDSRPPTCFDWRWQPVIWTLIKGHGSGMSVSVSVYVCVCVRVWLCVNMPNFVEAFVAVYGRKAVISKWQGGWKRVSLAWEWQILNMCMCLCVCVHEIDWWSSCVCVCDNVISLSQWGRQEWQKGVCVPMYMIFTGIKICLWRMKRTY